MAQIGIREEYWYQAALIRLKAAPSSHERTRKGRLSPLVRSTVPHARWLQAPSNELPSLWFGPTIMRACAKHKGRQTMTCGPRCHRFSELIRESEVVPLSSSTASMPDQTQVGVIFAAESVSAREVCGVSCANNAITSRWVPRCQRYRAVMAGNSTMPSKFGLCCLG